MATYASDNNRGDSDEDAGDIRSVLSAAIDQGAEPAAEAVSPETETDSPDDGRARGADGKFVAKAEETETVETKTGEEPAKAEAEKSEVKTDVKAEPSVEPPANWAEADKAKFKGAPQELQSWLLDRHKSMEADYTRKTQAVAALKSEYEPVAKMLEPWSEKMRAAGITPSGLIQSWAAVEQRLMNGEAIEVIKGLSQHYRVDPLRLAGEILRAAKLADPDQAVQQLLGEVKAPPPAQIPPELAAEIAAIRHRLAADDTNKVNAEISRINSEVERFRSAADDKGALLHPHFETVMPAMALLAEQAKAQGQKISLDDLYTQAVWANPSTRAEILQARDAAARSEIETAQQVAARKAQEEARAKANHARKAGSSVTGAPSAGQGGTRANGKDQSLSIRDALLAAAEEHDSAIH